MLFYTNSTGRMSDGGRFLAAFPFALVFAGFFFFVLITYGAWPAFGIWAAGAGLALYAFRDKVREALQEDWAHIEARYGHLWEGY